MTTAPAVSKHKISRSTKFALTECIRNSDNPLAIRQLVADHRIVRKRLIDDLIVDAGSHTLLSFAALKGRLAVVMMLFQEFNCDPNKVSRGGRTPVMHAASQNHYDTVVYLVENCNADVAHRNSFGKGALDIAKQNGYVLLTQYLASKLTEANEVSDQHDIISRLVAEKDQDRNQVGIFMKKNKQLGKQLANAKTEIGRLKQEVQTLRRDLDNMRKQRQDASLRPERDRRARTKSPRGSRGGGRDASNEIDELRSMNAELEVSNNQYKRQIDSLEEKIAELSSKIEETPPMLDNLEPEPEPEPTTRRGGRGRKSPARSPARSPASSPRPGRGRARGKNQGQRGRSSARGKSKARASQLEEETPPATEDGSLESLQQQNQDLQTEIEGLRQSELALKNKLRAEEQKGMRAMKAAKKGKQFQKENEKLKAQVAQLRAQLANGSVTEDGATEP